MGLQFGQANISGYSNFSNIFHDQRACAVAAFLGVAANGCDRVNIDQLPLSPTIVITADLKLNWYGIMVRVLLCLYLGVHDDLWVCII